MSSDRAPNWRQMAASIRRSRVWRVSSSPGRMETLSTAVMFRLDIEFRFSPLCQLISPKNDGDSCSVGHVTRTIRDQSHGSIDVELPFAISPGVRRRTKKSRSRFFLHDEGIVRLLKVVRIGAGIVPFAGILLYHYWMGFAAAVWQILQYGGGRIY
jgi:hypothetical protein